MKVLRVFITSVVFYSNFVTLSDFERVQSLFQWNHIVLIKQPIFWTFWEVLQIQSHYTENLLILAILLKLKAFLQPTDPFLKETQISNSLTNIVISVPIYCNFALSRSIQKVSCFFAVNPSNLFKKTQVLKVCRNIPIAVAFQSKIATSSNSQNNSRFFSEKPFLSNKEPMFERFEESDYLSLILQLNCFP